MLAELSPFPTRRDQQPSGEGQATVWMSTSTSRRGRTMTRRITGCAMVAITAVIAASAPGPTFKAEAAAPSAGHPLIAVTVDDIPAHGGTAPGETRLDISRRLVAALRAEGVPARGFVNGSRAEADPDGMAALEYWASAFPVGNHTWSHADLNELTAGAYGEEIARNEPLLERISGGDWHWFRYPYLQEGDDPVTRLAIRQYLASRGYRVAGVTMAFDDWKYNDAYVRCAVRGDQAAIAKLEED
ncbi:polysaccharide deacetylase family protein [Pseudonocardia sp. NPDC049154]|uniref:polysaccharide deacetylase family protein n=1 Tax=Pseudonocardia sp. NPDC049154 TaxID=3155501 RepID=UPI003406F902